jgi:hypothetical protein
VSAKGLAEATRALRLVTAIPTSPSGLPSPEEGSSRDGSIEAKVREGDDDHFYGPWKGGSKAEGGRPGSGGGAKVDYAAKPSTPWGDAKGAKWLKQNEGRYDEDPQFRAAADTITGYTTGSYEVLRAASAGDVRQGIPEHLLAEPDKFPEYQPDAMLAKRLGEDRFDRGFAGRAFPQQVDPADPTATVKSQHTIAEGAAALNAFVDASPRRPEPIYRGLGEYTTYKKLDDVGRPRPKVGDVMDISGASSFTRDRGIAERFASRTVAGAKSGAQPDREWLFEARNARGIDVDALSPWRQKEVISRGRFRVAEVNIHREYETNFFRSERQGGGWEYQPVRQPRQAGSQRGQARSREDFPAETIHVVLEGID